MKIVIFGSRSINDFNLLDEVMRTSNAIYRATEIVSGGAKGVDTLAKQWAEKYGFKFVEFKAKWNDLDAPGARIEVGQYGMYNALAGLWRNEDMARYSDAGVGLWDGISTGTKHMADFLKGLGKKVYVRTITINNKDSKRTR